MRRALVIALAFLSCHSKEGERPKPGAATPSPAPATPADVPAMPPYPDAGRGRMVVVAGVPAGMEEIRHDWAGEAGWCENPPMLQVKAEQVAVGGTLVLLALPANKVTTYPVALVTQGLPTPPAAQVGVQVFSRYGSFAYQATEGSVDLYAFAKTVSGRFAVTLREITRNDRIRYAGAFRELPLVKLDPSLCTPAAGGVGEH